MHFTCLIPPVHVKAICENTIAVCSYGPIEGVMHGSIKIADSDESIVAIHFHSMSHEEMLQGLTMTVANIQAMHANGKWDGQAIPCSFNNKPTIVPVSSIIGLPCKATRVSVSTALGIFLGVL